MASDCFSRYDLLPRPVYEGKFRNYSMTQLLEEELVPSPTAYREEELGIFPSPTAYI